MNFLNYQKYREAILAQRPTLIDAGETNLYRALSSLVPKRPELTHERVHRCHLASKWAECFGFSGAVSSRAFVSCGVRHSLTLIFQGCAAMGAKVWIPEDNYPVFSELALAAGMVPITFPTLPEPTWPNASSSDAEFLLVTNPLKPLGRYLNTNDLRSLTDWLGSNPHRRVIIDTVYDLGARFHSSTVSLIETKQALLLHSLTKGWLHARLFGIALVPESDADHWRPCFQNSAPPQTNLAAARHFLARYQALPRKVAASIGEAKAILASTLPHLLGNLLKCEAPGYLFPAKASFDALLEKNVLGIPASVFGSSRKDLTLLSSLSCIQK